MNIFKLGFMLGIIISSMFGDTLKIGVLPTMDSQKMITMNQPLKEFLETELKQNVEIYTSNGYDKFFYDTKNGDFDIIVTGPHFGALHIQDGFIPVLKYSTHLKPIFVVLKSSKINTVKDLKNKRIALSNYLSASSIGGLKALLDAKLQNNLDFKLLNTNSHLSAIMSVVVGDADAAITTNTPLVQLTDEVVKSKIRYFESGFDMPHLFTIAHPRVSKDKIKLLKTALLKFENSSSGRLFFKDTGYQGYNEISKKDINVMKPVLKETKLFLGIK